MSPPGPKVIIAGAGIAGPILAIFLKLNGYSPVIYERQPKGSQGGIALALQPNGLRVLDMIPGLLSKVQGATVDHLQFYSVEPSDPGLLASSSIIADLVEAKAIAYPWITTPRPHFHSLIISEAQNTYGIPIFYEYCVMAVQENIRDETVSVIFQNGAKDTASFVVGCDGLHSRIRGALFGKDKANFTGMTQMGGHSPIPADKTLLNGMTNIFGDGVHFISYPTSDNAIGWVITQHEPEMKETWKPMDKAGQDAIRRGLYSKLPYGAGDCVRTCRNIIKYGLYDRPELPSWYKGRVLLIGDAAHPTSPHLGQGANQAFEDIYHLVRLLNKFNSEDSFSAPPSPTSSVSSLSSIASSATAYSTPPAPSTFTLTQVFSSLTALRIPRTSALVKGARAQGELRLVHGVDNCVVRNDKIRSVWKDEGTMIKGYAAVWKGGFEDADAKSGEHELLQRMNIQK